MRRMLSAALAVLAAVVMAITAIAPASADSGTSYIYKCSSITDGNYVISFSKIYTCSNGPYDVTFVNKYSTYSGTRVAWIDGECAFYAYHVLGWRNMSTIWSKCLSHHDIPG